MVGSLTQDSLAADLLFLSCLLDYFENGLIARCSSRNRLNQIKWIYQSNWLSTGLQNWMLSSKENKQANGLQISSCYLGFIYVPWQATVMADRSMVSKLLDFVFIPAQETNEYKQSKIIIKFQTPPGPLGIALQSSFICVLLLPLYPTWEFCFVC